MNVRPRYDVVLFAPSVAPLLSRTDIGATGGAETQLLLIARLIVARGYRVCLATYDAPGADIPPSIDGVDIALRPPYERRGKIARLREAIGLGRDLAALDGRVYVTRIASYHVGIVAIAARLRRRRFVYSSAHVADFEFERFSPPLRDRILYRLGIALTNHIVVQTKEQAALCRDRYGRDSQVIPNVVEQADPRPAPGDTFLWVGRAVWYKGPLAYVDLAREMPDAQFLAVCPPQRGQEQVTEDLEVASRQIPNLTLLDQRPRRELLQLLDRAVAVVNTSTFEGMPNVTLEGWARGVPTVTLNHDPDGLIEAHQLGEFANGSWPAFVAGARRLWENRLTAAGLSERCRVYIAEEHGADVIVSHWIEALRLEPQAPTSVPVAEAA